MCAHKIDTVFFTKSQISANSNSREAKLVSSLVCVCKYFLWRAVFNFLFMFTKTWIVYRRVVHILWFWVTQLVCVNYFAGVDA
jgi:hypothetical protein